ncbi:MAG: hypothetical protein H7Z43_00085 [Clostridia bacterium]|nr:hypothetical protein [Deltaproteobacteria bacterium]
MRRSLAVIAVSLFSAGIAVAIPSDATVQNILVGSGGLNFSGSVTPNEDNGTGVRAGRVFCTLYDGGRCEPINLASCNNDTRRIDFAITATAGTIQANSRMEIFATSGTCAYVAGQLPAGVVPDTLQLPANNKLVAGQTINYQADVASARFSTVADIAAAIGACGNTPIENARYNFCIAVSVSDGNTAPTGIASGSPIIQGTFLVDTVAPDAPATFSATGGDGAFNVTVGMASNNNQINRYIFRYREAENQGETEVAADIDCNTWATGTYQEQSSVRRGDADDASSFSVSNITNGTTYEVCAGAVDIAGNTGPFSVTRAATPRNECDFIECYPGKAPTGYCGSITPGMLAGWLSLTGLSRSIVRRRRVSRGSRGVAKSSMKRAYAASREVIVGTASALAVALFVGLAPSAAYAQWNSEDFYRSDITPLRKQRPQFGFEVRGGPFKPKIGTAAEQRIYDIIYGGDTGLFDDRPLMLQFEFDWYAFTDVGLLGLYGRLGHWRISGRTRDCTAADGTIQSCTQDNLDASVPGRSKTSLTTLPLSAGIVYKFDWFKEEYSVPLVPYVKGGAEYFFWFNSANGKSSKASDGSTGQGGQLGVSGSVGIALNIDFIEPTAATHARNGSDIADAYIFFEYRWTYAGFRNDGLDWSDNHGLVGLGIDLL